MKKISISLTRDILARHFEHGMGPREISREVSGVTLATASRRISEFTQAGLNWAEVKDLPDDEFKSLLNPGVQAYVEVQHECIYEYLRRNRKRSLEQAYNECYLKQQAPGGQFYKYSRFCELYGKWLKTNTGYQAISCIPCEPGDYVEIDFSGDILVWRDYDGIRHSGHVFVATLRFSKLMYAQVFDNEKTESWLRGTVAALEFFGGTPKALVCDNARALIQKADEHVGEVTAALNFLCEHYQMHPHTTPVQAPKHKQAAEFTANVVQTTPQQELMGSFGEAVAGNLQELNKALLQKVEDYNMKRWTTSAAGSRRSCFEAFERPFLNPLPILPYEIRRWTVLTASKRYLVNVDGQAYMVHWQQAGKRVVACLSACEVRFYSLDDYHLVGRYERAYGQYGVHVSTACMSPADLTLRCGFDGMAQKFRDKGYDLPCIMRFLKTLFDNDRLPQMTKINIVRAFCDLCKKHGAKFVNQQCEWAEANGCLHMYPKIKQRIYKVLKDINNRKRGADNASGGAK